MRLGEIIEKARAVLPLTSEVEHDRIRVLVKNDNINVELDSQLDAPTRYCVDYYEVEFRKQIVEGIIIGWEFVGLVNGA